MKTIYKYELALTSNVQEVEMPFNSKVLCVQNQYNKPCIWVEVDSENANQVRKFYILGTGRPKPSNPSLYIGTVQINSGEYVFHVFELL